MKMRAKDPSKRPPEFMFDGRSHGRHLADSPTMLDTDCETCARAIAEHPDRYVEVPS